MADITKILADELAIAARQNAAKGNATSIVVTSIIAATGTKSPGDIMHLTREVSVLIESLAAEFSIEGALQILADHIAYRRDIPVQVAAGLVETLSPESRLALFEAWVLIGAKVFAEQILERRKPKKQIEMATYGNRLKASITPTFEH